MTKHPAFHAVSDIESDLGIARGLALALYQLIGEEVDKTNPDRHEALLTVCIEQMKALEGVRDKFNLAFDATKDL
jgi:hypothetical protein